MVNKKKTKKDSKLVAILHDGSFDGDNGFSCPSCNVVYKEGQTFEQIKEAFFKKMLKEEGMDDDKDSREYLNDMIGEPVGAWIVTKDQEKTIGLVWESDPGNDSAVYMCNFTAKKMANRLAIKHLGKRPR